ncbi:hypothetical protein BGX33_012464 [Mortierella sp. NVP41]|nr:hypothetical protein BGX33_012464 [Mortierella sp. NVP41]
MHWTDLVPAEIATQETVLATGLVVLAQGFVVGSVTYSKAEEYFLKEFFFKKTITERINMLDSIERKWTTLVPKADKKVYTLVNDYDIDYETRRPWERAWDDKWEQHLRTKRCLGVLVTRSKEEFRFFYETCGGMSLVTGQPISERDSHCDRVFNTDSYALENCILIEGALNSAKGRLPEFMSSHGFAGNKIHFAIERLQTILQELLEERTKLGHW